MFKPVKKTALSVVKVSFREKQLKDGSAPFVLEISIGNLDS